MAQFKKTKGGDGEDDDSDWESDIEEDFPHMQITELLDNLKLDETPLNKGEEEEDEDEDEEEKE